MAWVYNSVLQIMYDIKQIFFVAIFINWSNFMNKWFITQKIYSKMFLHHDVTTFKVDGTVQNIKALISQNQHMTFPWK